MDGWSPGMAMARERIRIARLARIQSHFHGIHDTETLALQFEQADFGVLAISSGGSRRASENVGTGLPPSAPGYLAAKCSLDRLCRQAYRIASARKAHSKFVTEHGQAVSVAEGASCFLGCRMLAVNIQIVAGILHEDGGRAQKSWVSS